MVAVLRVLCLHGAHQTSEIFANQLSKLTSSLHDVAQFDFIDAPHELPLLNLQDDAHTRSWSIHKDKTNNMVCTKTNTTSVTTMKIVEIETDEEQYTESDVLLDKEMMEKQYDILLGFSQGALMICRYVMRHSEQFLSSTTGNKIKGVILAGAPDPRQLLARTELLEQHVYFLEHMYTCNNCSAKEDKSVHCQMNDNESQKLIHTSNCNESQSSSQEVKSVTSFFVNVPSLHIIGRQDTIVPCEESLLFAEACRPNATCVLHDHAHSFPQLKVIIDAVRLFCEELQNKNDRHGNKQDNNVIAMDEEMLAAKSSELEMIASMYGEDCVEYCHNDGSDDTITEEDKLRNTIVVSLPLLPELAYEHYDRSDEDIKYKAHTESDAATVTTAINNNSSSSCTSLEHILSHLLLCFTLLPEYPASLPILSIRGGPNWHSVGFEKWKRALLDKCREFMRESLHNGDGMLILSTMLCASTEANNSMAELRDSVVNHTTSNSSVAISGVNNSCGFANTTNYSNCKDNNNNNSNESMTSPVITPEEDAKWLNEDAAARSAFITQSEVWVIEMLAKRRKANYAKCAKSTSHESENASSVEEQEEEEYNTEDEKEREEDTWNRNMDADKENTNECNNPTDIKRSHTIYSNNMDSKYDYEIEDGSVALEAKNTGSGSWKLTIGLIGKPSAGKSTFFNAVTDPQSESEAAKVAAFPFTTIEPNIGSGYGPVFCPCSVLPTENIINNNTHGKSTKVYLECSVCDANYGHVHDSAHRTFRRHPVMIKDVAGLVQGAYEGKGKGNQFLNDLCDADVLIHVVDGAAATDASGTSCTPGQGSTLEDITWVRAEVHNWVYDNLRRKWNAIARMPTKFKTMFTGYHSGVGFVQYVLSLLNIHDDDALCAAIRSWGPAELHRFVACYVHLRFPMINALNKSDLPTAQALHSQLVRKYPHETFVPMSAQVECDLLTLRKRSILGYLSGEPTFTLHPQKMVNLSKEDRERLDRIHLFFSTDGNTVNEEEVSNTSRECKEMQHHSISSKSTKKCKSNALLHTTGVQDVLMAALSQCAALFVFPVRSLRPCISSLKHCFTFKRGTQAETVFWSMTYAHLIDGKLVRFEYVNARKPDEDVMVIKKADVIMHSAVLVRVLTNKRQMS